jgi:hypothetical protein
MRLFKSIIFTAMTILLAVMFACGDDDPVGGGGGGGGGCGTTADVSGNWQVLEQETSNSCGDNKVYRSGISITQNADTVSVTTPDGTFDGTVCGRVATFGGDFPKQGGTATFTATLTLSPDGQSLSGPTTWSWVAGTENCNGTSTSFAVKDFPTGPCASPVDVAGVWTIKTQDVINSCTSPQSDEFDITIVQNGANLLVTTPAGTFMGSVCGNIIYWTGQFDEQNGTTTIEVMSLKVAADEQSLSGASLWSWTDGSETCYGGNTITGTRGNIGPGNSFTGDWGFAEHIVGCGTSDDIDYEYNIVQTGATTAEIEYGLWNATVDGNRIMWTETYSWLDTTITADYDLTAAGNWNSMSGSSDWVFQKGGVTFCTGNGTVNATRITRSLATIPEDKWIDVRNRFLTTISPSRNR